MRGDCAPQQRAPVAARIAAIALSLFLFGQTVEAHPLAPALLELHERADGVTDVRWKQPLASAPGAHLRPVIPHDCVALNAPTTRQTPDDGGLQMTWSIRCDGGLAGRRFGVDGLDAASSHALLRIELADGTTSQRLLSADENSFVASSKGITLDVIRDYALLGVRQMTLGPDHLLLLLGLFLLVGTSRSLAPTIAGFTLGHSSVLSLAVLGDIRFSSGFADIGSALTVLFLALALAEPRRTSSWLRRFPVSAACAFGVLHGLVFAEAFRLDSPADGIPLALLAFNVGIEVAELSLILLTLAAAKILRRLPIAFPRWLAQLPIYAMGSLAVFWSLQRVAALWW